MNDGVVVRNLKVNFGKDVAIDDLSITLPTTGMIGLSGESGSGKSTLIKVVSGELHSFKGSVVCFGKSLKGLSEVERRDYRIHNVGILTQTVDLLESETAMNNVMFILDSCFEGKASLKRRRAMDLLCFAGCSNFVNSYVNKLSGGQRQKVGLACSMANDPKLLLTDEPTGALDPQSAKEIMECLRGISKSRLVIVASHDTELLEEYCDQIVSLKSGSIVSHVSRNCDKQGKALLAPSLLPKEGDPQPSAIFKMRHAAHIMGKRKWRSLLSLSAMIVSMMGISSGAYLFSSIGEEVKSAIGAVIPQNQVWVKSKGAAEAQTTAFAASDTDIAVVLDAFPDLFAGSGSTLLFDFRSIFADGDQVMLTLGNKSVPLPYLSASSFNDFLCPLEIDEIVYPEFPSKMEMDEIVLGLPFDDLSALCFNLSLERNYESFAEAIGYGCSLLLSVANRGMDYYDEQLFTVIGIAKTPSPCIIHSDKKFNYRLFVDVMKFNPIISSDPNNPQQVFALPFLYLKQDYDAVIPILTGQPFSDWLIFDPASGTYLPSLYAIDDFTSMRRLYVYNYENKSIKTSDIVRLTNKIDGSGYAVISPSIWYCDGESVISGFAGSFLFSADYDDLFSSGEMLSSGQGSGDQSSSFLPDTVLDGNFLSSSRGGLRLSCYLGGKIRGKAPQKLNEICVSSRIYEEFGHPETIYAAVEVPSATSSNSTKDIRYFDFSVTGVIDDEQPTIYAKDNWLYEFYLLECKMSALSLLPTMAYLFVDDPESAKAIFAKENANYIFVNPNDLIDASFGGATDYIFAIVMFFSSLCLLLSLVLFKTLLRTTYDELSSERRHIMLIGLSEREEKSMFRCICLTNVLVALLSSLASVIFLEFAVHRLVKESFGGTSSFAISYWPLLALAVCGLAFYLMSFLPFGSKPEKG